MPNTVFQFERSSDAMRNKIRGLQMLRDAVELLSHEQKIEIQRRGDTDGSDDTNYARLATAGVFAAGDKATPAQAARGSFEKINDLLFKLTTDASVAQFASALADTCAQHGV